MHVDGRQVGVDPKAADTGLLRGLPEGGPQGCRGRIPSQCPPSCTQRRMRGCNVSNTLWPASSTMIADAVMCPGTQRLKQASSFASRKANTQWRKAS